MGSFFASINCKVVPDWTGADDATVCITLSIASLGGAICCDGGALGAGGGTSKVDFLGIGSVDLILFPKLSTFSITFLISGGRGMSDGFGTSWTVLLMVDIVD